MKRDKKQDQLITKRSAERLFNAEIASSERLRALILIGLLGLEAVLLMVIYYFYRNQYLSLFNTHIAIYAILIFALIIILYEAFIHFFIGKKMKMFFHHKSIFGYVNSFSEISLLTGLSIFL